ncbi:MAG: DUF5591 domain-containing protein [Candidatus Thorarchaeota archaeon]
MVRFLISRGHDGPAREGQLEFDGMKIKTPLLMGTSTTHPDIEILHQSHKHGDEHTTSIISLGSIFNKQNEDVVTESDKQLLLLPSLPSLSFFSDKETTSILDMQLELAKEFRPSNVAVRIPASIELETAEGYYEKFHALGIRAATFSFMGNSGETDLNNLVLRTGIPRNWTMIATGMIPPSLIPLIYYSGFDVIDIELGNNAASENIRLWPMMFESIERDTLPRFCSCSGCIEHENIAKLDAKSLHDTLRTHNSNIYRSILSECVHAKNNGKLRWLVESFTHSNPSLASLLRHVDKQIYDFLEEFTPTTGKSEQALIGPESYYSPLVRRYRNYLTERYTPPTTKKIVLLLPCSARKPYSDSRSHKRFRDTIEYAIGSQSRAIAETILTSPLGVIPRELERGFPLAQYDIPVTGTWDFEETEIAAELLAKHLNKFNKDAVVIAHVAGGYQQIVRRAESLFSHKIIYTTNMESATSRIALDNLTLTLQELRIELSLKGGRPTLLEDTLHATADFQFGPGAGDLLVPTDAKVRGKVYGTILCQDEKEQLCAYIGSSGTLSLTLAGARKIATLNRYWVRFEGDIVKGSTLFAIGIKEADDAIRPGDEVIVLDPNNNVIAVGRSEMSGREMCDFDNGRAVSIRHKVG